MFEEPPQRTERQQEQFEQKVREQLPQLTKEDIQRLELQVQVQNNDEGVPPTSEADPNQPVEGITVELTPEQWALFQRLSEDSYGISWFAPYMFGFYGAIITAIIGPLIVIWWKNWLGVRQKTRDLFCKHDHGETPDDE